MTNDEGREPEGAPERSPKAGAGGPSGVDGNGPKRFSVQRKLAIVTRLLALPEVQESKQYGQAQGLADRRGDSRGIQVGAVTRCPSSCARPA